MVSVPGWARAQVVSIKSQGGVRGSGESEEVEGGGVNQVIIITWAKRLKRSCCWFWFSSFFSSSLFLINLPQQLNLSLFLTYFMYFFFLLNTRLVKSDSLKIHKNHLFLSLNQPLLRIHTCVHLTGLSFYFCNWTYEGGLSWPCKTLHLTLIG